MSSQYDRPIIGYDNLLTNSAATVASDGTNGANAYDWRTDDSWTTGAASGYLRTTFGSTQPMNYVAVVGHDLGTNGATVKMQRWNGASYDDIAGSSYTPPDDTAFMLIFDNVDALRYQFVVTTGGTAATIAVVSFGQRLELERGITSEYTPPTLSRQDTYYNNVAHSGAFVGRALVRSGITGSLALQNLSKSWVRVDLDPFITASRTQGWFILWNHNEHPNEVGYCWTTSTPQPVEIGDGFMNCTITYNGLIE